MFVTIGLAVVAIGGYGEAEGRVAPEFHARLSGFPANRRTAALGAAAVDPGEAVGDLLATVSPRWQTGTARG